METRTISGKGGAGGNEPNVTEREVLESLRALRYGSIEITVHDGRIVQLERREKKRFNENEQAARGNGAAA